MYLTAPSNKGTIHTAELLAEAASDEERAAIWIAATAKEMGELKYSNALWKCADKLYLSAREYLKDRSRLWHHAMKRLVPDILFPYEILENIDGAEEKTVTWVIQANTILLKSTWSILRYSSMNDGENRDITLGRI